MGDWTPEPWEAMTASPGYVPHIVSLDGNKCLVLQGSPDHIGSPQECNSNVQRVVSCVNAMQGIEDPEAFVKAADALARHAPKHQYMGAILENYKQARGSVEKGE